MLAKLRGFMATEVFKYLFFGILATLVYMVSRTLIFQLTKQGTLSAVLANAIAIIFAFFTNDIFVFNQETAGMAACFHQAQTAQRKCWNPPQGLARPGTV